MEAPKDRDFVETVEGLLFCIVGYLHPDDRYTAYLKYVPSKKGRWSREGTRYSRAIPYYHVSQVENTYGFLKERYPQYLFKCPVRNITISSVPHTSVKTYYRPRTRLMAIMNEGAGDTLVGKVVELVEELCNRSGLRHDDLGVTGSILTGTHSPDFSDIDLTVYGRSASRRLREAMIRIREDGNKIERLSYKKMREWSRGRSQYYPLSFDELMVISKRRWDYGTYDGKYFSIHPVRTDDEISERYGDQLYRQQGQVVGTARVTDNSEALYLPAIYRVEDAKIGNILSEVEQIVSFEGIFSDVFRKGERINFAGILEKVTGKKNFHQVVIGGSGHSLGFLKAAALDSQHVF